MLCQTMTAGLHEELRERSELGLVEQETAAGFNNHCYVLTLWWLHRLLDPQQLTEPRMI